LLCIPRLKSKKTAQFNNLNIVLNRFLNSFMTNARFFGWQRRRNRDRTRNGDRRRGQEAGGRDRKKIVLICWIWS
jgi:hypothetical protein